MNPKDLIFITANCPSPEQEALLEKCVNSVADRGYDIAVISHTHVPIHIQKKCQYYIYDHLNDVSYDENLFGERYFSFGDKVIKSILFQKSFYGFAIYRMFSLASKLAINFGYQNIHHIEYDCELFDINLIKEHSDLLDEYDSLIYTDTGMPTGLLFGSFKSFSVKKLPELFANYNREKMEEIISKMKPKHLEYFTKVILRESGNLLIKPAAELTASRFKNGVWFSDGFHYTIYYNPDNNTIDLFYQSRKNEEENIVVIINKESIFNIDIKAGYWVTRQLGDFNSISHIRIDNSEKILYNKILTEEFKETLKKTSYVSDGKDN